MGIFLLFLSIKSSHENEDNIKNSNLWGIPSVFGPPFAPTAAEKYADIAKKEADVQSARSASEAANASATQSYRKSYSRYRSSI